MEEIKPEVPDMPIKRVTSKPAPTAKPAPKQTPRVNFLVVNYDGHTMQIQPESVVFGDSADIEADIVIPMMSPSDLDRLPQAIQTNFWRQFRELLAALDEGVCPLLPEAEPWIQTVASMFEDDETLEEPEEEPSEEQESYVEADHLPTFMSAHSDEVFGMGFEHGFQAGINFLMQRPHLLNSLNSPAPQPVEEAPVSTELPPEKKGALLQALRKERIQKEAKGRARTTAKRQR
jgi:hypothetical protein